MERLIRQNVQRQAFQQIKRYIIDSKLQPGDMLPTELQIAQKLGISRSVVREALKSMEFLGIIDSQQGRGRFVREFNFDALLDGLLYNTATDIKKFADILELRVNIECAFITKSLDQFSESDIKELHTTLARLEALFQEGASEEELIEHHHAFHMVLHRYSHNELLVELIRVFSITQRTLTAEENFTTDGPSFLRKHRLIVTAVERRDAALLASAMEEHFAEPMQWVDRKLKRGKS